MYKIACMKKLFVTVLTAHLILFCHSIIRSQTNCPNYNTGDVVGCIDCGLNIADLYEANFDPNNININIDVLGVQQYPCCGTIANPDHENQNAGCSIVELNFTNEFVGFRIVAAGAGANSGDVRITDDPNDFCNALIYSVLQDFIQGNGFCVSDPTATYYLMICKPGTNDYTLELEGILAETFGDTTTLVDDNALTAGVDCNYQINAGSTVPLSNITWSGFTVNDDISYLDCGSGPGVNLNCLDPIFTPPGGLTTETTFSYEICGDYNISDCDNPTAIQLCDTVLITVVPQLALAVDPIITCGANFAGEYPFSVTVDVDDQVGSNNLTYNWYDAPDAGGNLIGGWAHSRDLIYVPSLSIIAWVLFSTFILHVTTNHVSYYLKIRKEKW